MDIDVPWEVRWNREFEDAVEELKDAGRWDNLRGKIKKIITAPVQVGKYKDGSLKGCRTTHIGEKVIGWQVKPGVGSDQQEKVEEICFLFIVHHDDMGTGITGYNPVEKSSEFEVDLPYYGGFEMGKKINEMYQAAKKVDGFRVFDPDWQNDQVVVKGIIPPDSRDILENVLPDTAEVSYDDPTLFD